MNKEFKERLLNDKKAFDILGLKYLTPEDKRAANYVANSLGDIKTGAIVSEKTVLFEDIFHKSVANMKIFGDDISLSSFRFSLVSFLPIINYSYAYMTRIIFDVDDKTMQVDRESGRVESFKIPKKMDEVTADIFLTHEFIHGLKDVNYNEYILVNSLGDVIPLFYEMIQVENDVRKKEFLNIRMNLLNNERYSYIDVSTRMKKSKNDKDLYKVVQSRSGEYLNSFYYALGLYHIYRKNPKRILELVKKVLNKEITTLDMLLYLGIYHVNLDREFSYELNEIRKVLK